MDWKSVEGLHKGRIFSFHFLMLSLSSTKQEKSNELVIKLGLLFHLKLSHFSIITLVILLQKFYRCFCSVAQSRLNFYDPMDCSTPGLPIFHHLLEFAQILVHWIGDAIQPSYSLSPSSHLPSISPRIKVFSNELALHVRWPKYWSFSISCSNEHSGVISLELTGLILLAV